MYYGRSGNVQVIPAPAIVSRSSCLISRGLPRCKNLWIFSLFGSYCLSALYCFEVLVALLVLWFTSLASFTGFTPRMNRKSGIFGIVGLSEGVRVLSYIAYPGSCRSIRYAFDPWYVISNQGM